MQLNGCRTLVEYSPFVIRALLQTRARLIAEEDAHSIEDEDLQFPFTSKRSQRQRKGARPSPKLSLDAKTTKAFEYFGFEASDHSMTEDRISMVMEELLRILKVIRRSSN